MITHCRYCSLGGDHNATAIAAGQRHVCAVSLLSIKFELLLLLVLLCACISAVGSIYAQTLLTLRTIAAHIIYTYIYDSNCDCTTADSVRTPYYICCDSLSNSSAAYVYV
jgi:hypothetical protein